MTGVITVSAAETSGIVDTCVLQGLDGRRLSWCTGVTRCVLIGRTNWSSTAANIFFRMAA